MMRVYFGLIPAAIIALSGCGDGPTFAEPLSTSVPIAGTLPSEMFGSMVVGLELDDRPGLELAISSPTYFPEGAGAYAGRLTLVTFDDRTPRVLQQIDGQPGVVLLGVYGATIADVDGNGSRELLVSATTMAGEGVYVFPIQSNGVIDTTAPKLATVLYGEGTGLGDFNGDGFEDVLVIGQTSTTTLYIGSTNGLSMTPVWQNNTPGSGPFSGGVADLDEDGHRDVVVGQRTRDMTQSGALVFAFGPLPLTDLAVIGGSGEQLGGDLGIGDVNGDGDLDLVVTAGGVDAIYVYHGPLGRDPATIVPGQGIDGPVGFGDRLVVADPDGDGNSDVIVANPQYSAAGFIDEGSISVFSGGGKSLGAPVDISPVDVAQARFGSFIAAADVDGDGIDDLAVTQGGNVRVLFGECGGEGRCVDENQTRYLACNAGEPLRGTPILLALLATLRRRRNVKAARRRSETRRRRSSPGRYR